MARDVDVIAGVFRDAAEAHRKFAEDRLPEVLRAAETIAQALLAGRKVLAFGNGGSAADADHLAAELVGRFEGPRRALAAVALTASPSVMTSVANDYGYEQVFARQVEALGASGDIAFGISTSGRSMNVEAALATAKALGLVTVALTGGDGGRMGADADIHLNVAERSTPRIQEVHRTVLHAICSVIDRRVRLGDA